MVATSSGAEAFPLGGRGGTTLGFETSLDVLGGGPSTSTYSKEFRRIGKIRMIWEESVSLWAEEGEHHRGRVKIQGSSFLNADEITFLDDSMVACTMEAFEDGPLKGFSVDRFLPGQHVKVFGRRKSFFVPVPIPSGMEYIEYYRNYQFLYCSKFLLCFFKRTWYNLRISRP